MNHKRHKPRNQRGHTARCCIGVGHKPYKYGWVPRDKRLRVSEQRKVQDETVYS